MSSVPNDSNLSSQPIPSSSYLNTASNSSFTRIPGVTPAKKRDTSQSTQHGSQQHAVSSTLPIPTFNAHSSFEHLFKVSSAASLHQLTNANQQPSNSSLQHHASLSNNHFQGRLRSIVSQALQLGLDASNLDNFFLTHRNGVLLTKNLILKSDHLFSASTDTVKSSSTQQMRNTADFTPTSATFFSTSNFSSTSLSTNSASSTNPQQDQHLPAVLAASSMHVLTNIFGAPRFRIISIPYSNVSIVSQPTVIGIRGVLNTLARKHQFMYPLPVESIPHWLYQPFTPQSTHLPITFSQSQPRLQSHQEQQKHNTEFAPFSPTNANSPHSTAPTLTLEPYPVRLKQRFKTKVVWVNAREEPIIYITHAGPFVLRKRTQPFANMSDFYGVGPRISLVEKRLKLDILNEISESKHGMLLIHYETQSGKLEPCWCAIENVQREEFDMEDDELENSDNFDSFGDNLGPSRLIPTQMDDIDANHTPKMQYTSRHVPNVITYSAPLQLKDVDGLDSHSPNLDKKEHSPVELITELNELQQEYTDLINTPVPSDPTLESQRNSAIESHLAQINDKLTQTMQALQQSQLSSSTNSTPPTPAPSSTASQQSGNHAHIHLPAYLKQQPTYQNFQPQLTPSHTASNASYPLKRFTPRGPNMHRDDEIDIHVTGVLTLDEIFSTLREKDNYDVELLRVPMTGNNVPRLTDIELLLVVISSRVFDNQRDNFQRLITAEKKVIEAHHRYVVTLQWELQKMQKAAQPNNNNNNNNPNQSQNHTLSPAQIPESLLKIAQQPVQFIPYSTELLEFVFNCQNSTGRSSFSSAICLLVQIFLHLIPIPHLIPPSTHDTHHHHHHHSKSQQPKQIEQPNVPHPLPYVAVGELTTTLTEGEKLQHLVNFLLMKTGEVNLYTRLWSTALDTSNSDNNAAWLVDDEEIEYSNTTKQLKRYMLLLCVGGYLISVSRAAHKALEQLNSDIDITHNPVPTHPDHHRNDSMAISAQNSLVGAETDTPQQPFRATLSISPTLSFIQIFLKILQTTSFSTWLYEHPRLIKLLSTASPETTPFFAFSHTKQLVASLLRRYPLVDKPTATVWSILLKNRETQNELLKSYTALRLEITPLPHQTLQTINALNDHAHQGLSILQILDSINWSPHFRAIPRTSLLATGQPTLIGLTRLLHIALNENKSGIVVYDKSVSNRHKDQLASHQPNAILHQFYDNNDDNGDNVGHGDNAHHKVEDSVQLVSKLNQTNDRIQRQSRFQNQYHHLIRASSITATNAHMETMSPTAYYNRDHAIPSQNSIFRQNAQNMNIFKDSGNSVEDDSDRESGSFSRLEKINLCTPSGSDLDGDASSPIDRFETDRSFDAKSDRQSKNGSGLFNNANNNTPLITPPTSSTNTQPDLFFPQSNPVSPQPDQSPFTSGQSTPTKPGTSTSTSAKRPIRNRIIFINLREEPLCFVHGLPLALRYSSQFPRFQNTLLRQGNDETEQVLKADLQREILRCKQLYELFGQHSNNNNADGSQTKNTFKDLSKLPTVGEDDSLAQTSHANDSTNNTNNTNNNNNKSSIPNSNNALLEFNPDSDLTTNQSKQLNARISSRLNFDPHHGSFPIQFLNSQLFYNNVKRDDIITLQEYFLSLGHNSNDPNGSFIDKFTLKQLSLSSTEQLHHFIASTAKRLNSVHDGKSGGKLVNSTHNRPLNSIKRHASITSLNPLDQSVVAAGSSDGGAQNNNANDYETFHKLSANMQNSQNMIEYYRIPFQIRPDPPDDNAELGNPAQTKQIVSKSNSAGRSSFMNTNEFGENIEDVTNSKDKNTSNPANWSIVHSIDALLQVLLRNIYNPRTTALPVSLNPAADNYEGAFDQDYKSQVHQVHPTETPFDHNDSIRPVSISGLPPHILSSSNNNMPPHLLQELHLNTDAPPSTSTPIAPGSSQPAMPFNDFINSPPPQYALFTTDINPSDTQQHVHFEPTPFNPAVIPTAAQEHHYWFLRHHKAAAQQFQHKQTPSIFSDSPRAANSPDDISSPSSADLSPSNSTTSDFPALSTSTTSNTFSHEADEQNPHSLHAGNPLYCPNIEVTDTTLTMHSPTLVFSSFTAGRRASLALAISLLVMTFNDLLFVTETTRKEVGKQREKTLATAKKVLSSRNLREIETTDISLPAATGEKGNNTNDDDAGDGGDDDMTLPIKTYTFSQQPLVGGFRPSASSNNSVDFGDDSDEDEEYPTITVDTSQVRGHHEVILSLNRMLTMTAPKPTLFSSTSLQQQSLPPSAGPDSFPQHVSIPHPQIHAHPAAKPLTFSSADHFNKNKTQAHMMVDVNYATGPPSPALTPQTTPPTHHFQLSSRNTSVQHEQSHHGHHDVARSTQHHHHHHQGGNRPAHSSTTLPTLKGQLQLHPPSKPQSRLSAFPTPQLSRTNSNTPALPMPNAVSPYNTSGSGQFTTTMRQPSLPLQNPQTPPHMLLDVQNKQHDPLKNITLKDLVDLIIDFADTREHPLVLDDDTETRDNNTGTDADQPNLDQIDVNSHNPHYLQNILSSKNFAKPQNSQTTFDNSLAVASAPVTNLRELILLYMAQYQKVKKQEDDLSSASGPSSTTLPSDPANTPGGKSGDNPAAQSTAQLEQNKTKERDSKEQIILLQLSRALSVYSLLFCVCAYLRDITSRRCELAHKHWLEYQFWLHEQQQLHHNNYDAYDFHSFPTPPQPTIPGVHSFSTFSGPNMTANSSAYSSSNSNIANPAQIPSTTAKTPLSALNNEQYASSSSSSSPTPSALPQSASSLLNTVNSTAYKIETFSEWLDTHREVTKLLFDIFLTPQHGSTLVQSILPPAVLVCRQGEVLTQQDVLKSDAFAGIVNRDLGTLTAGVMNFRIICNNVRTLGPKCSGFNVAGVGIPTIFGLLQLLRYLTFVGMDSAVINLTTRATREHPVGIYPVFQNLLTHAQNQSQNQSQNQAQSTLPQLTHQSTTPSHQSYQNLANAVGNPNAQASASQANSTFGTNFVSLRFKSILWLNLREEPVIYVSGAPFVLRLASAPRQNLEQTGIPSYKVIRMESRLRDEAQRESERCHNRLFVHDENEKGDLINKFIDIKRLERSDLTTHVSATNLVGLADDSSEENRQHSKKLQHNDNDQLYDNSSLTHPSGTATMITHHNTPVHFFPNTNVYPTPTNLPTPNNQSHNHNPILWSNQQQQAYALLKSFGFSADEQLYDTLPAVQLPPEALSAAFGPQPHAPPNPLANIQSPRPSPPFDQAHISPLTVLDESTPGSTRKLSLFDLTSQTESLATTGQLSGQDNALPSPHLSNKSQSSPQSHSTKIQASPSATPSKQWAHNLQNNTFWLLQQNNSDGDSSNDDDSDDGCYDNDRLGRRLGGKQDVIEDDESDNDDDNNDDDQITTLQDEMNTLQLHESTIPPKTPPTIATAGNGKTSTPIDQLAPLPTPSSLASVALNTSFPPLTPQTTTLVHSKSGCSDQTKSQPQSQLSHPVPLSSDVWKTPPMTPISKVSAWLHQLPQHFLFSTTPTPTTLTPTPSTSSPSLSTATPSLYNSSMANHRQFATPGFPEASDLYALASPQHHSLLTCEEVWTWCINRIRSEHSLLKLPIPQISYIRAPVTDEQAPIPVTVNEIIQAICTAIVGCPVIEVEIDLSTFHTTIIRSQQDIQQSLLNADLPPPASPPRNIVHKSTTHFHAGSITASRPPSAAMAGFSTPPLSNLDEINITPLIERRKVYDITDLALIMNCQMGRGRTTTSIVLSSLILDSLYDAHVIYNANYPYRLHHTTTSKKIKEKEAAYKKVTSPDLADAATAHKASLEQREFEAKLATMGITTPMRSEQEEREFQALKRLLSEGYFPSIRTIVSALPSGLIDKHRTDIIIDSCSEMQNLRTCVAQTYSLYDDSRLYFPSQVSIHKHRGKNYLIRYIVLILCGAYLYQGGAVWSLYQVQQSIIQQHHAQVTLQTGESIQDIQDLYPHIPVSDIINYHHPKSTMHGSPRIVGANTPPMHAIGTPSMTATATTPSNTITPNCTFHLWLAQNTAIRHILHTISFPDVE